MEVIRVHKSKPKPVKSSTKTETFNLYKQGLSPLEISEQRGLQLMTIYSHLSQLYSEGKEVDLAKFIDPKTVEKVKEEFNKNDRKFELKPIFEALNEEVPYHEIRISMTLIMGNE